VLCLNTRSRPGHCLLPPFCGCSKMPSRRLVSENSSDSSHRPSTSARDQEEELMPAACEPAFPQSHAPLMAGALRGSPHAVPPSFSSFSSFVPETATHSADQQTWSSTAGLLQHEQTPSSVPPHAAFYPGSMSGFYRDAPPRAQTTPSVRLVCCLFSSLLLDASTDRTIPSPAEAPLDTKCPISRPFTVRQTPKILRVECSREVRLHAACFPLLNPSNDTCF
jgi:hypothetical protein